MTPSTIDNAGTDFGITVLGSEDKDEGVYCKHAEHLIILWMTDIYQYYPQVATNPVE